MKHFGTKTFFSAALLLIFLSAASAAGGVLRCASGGQVKTLDPVLADDLASRNLTAMVYDTLLQYDYRLRPYKLVPSMLSAMPKVSDDFRCYEFELRDDLYFSDDPLFEGKKQARKITSEDVRFSLLRAADVRLHSPVYWMFRGKIRGLEEFRKETELARPGDLSCYDRQIAGFTLLSERKFRIELTRPDPRFLYMLAMPNAGIVSRRAAAHYGDRFPFHPVGSGPFLLKRWTQNLRLDFVRNPEYREEFFPDSSGKMRRTPFPDGIQIFLIRQPMTAWMMFLQGELDFNALDNDNYAQLVSPGNQVIPALRSRGIQLVRNPEFEVRYVGFNFADPRLGKNRKLRQALSLSYDIARRVNFAAGQLIPVQGPIPPGIAGAPVGFVNPWSRYDLAAAKRLLTDAGYPGGIDPSTGEKLHLTFDQGGSDTTRRQIGELAEDDWRKLGIDVEPLLNSPPRFFDKLRQKRIQLFRLSWVGDYPDGENFLQLFYSKNIGGCNRINYADPEFDRMYEKAAAMPDTPERTKLYEDMVRFLADQCVWIYEGIPVTGVLHHRWLRNYLPCDFTFICWKYLEIDDAERERFRPSFTPLSFRELSEK